jgi:hypothetical protein
MHLSDWANKASGDEQNSLGIRTKKEKSKR